MPTFPLTQCPIYGSYGHDGPQATVARTQMEVGPPKVRRRTSLGRRTISAAYSVTRDEVETFEEWFADEAGMGAVTFDWTDPRTETVRAVKFAADSAYAVSMIAPGRWQISVTLEEWA